MEKLRRVVSRLVATDQLSVLRSQLGVSPGELARGRAGPQRNHRGLQLAQSLGHVGRKPGGVLRAVEPLLQGIRARSVPVPMERRHFSGERREYPVRTGEGLFHGAVRNRPRNDPRIEPGFHLEHPREASLEAPHGNEREGCRQHQGGTSDQRHQAPHRAAGAGHRQGSQAVAIGTSSAETCGGRRVSTSAGIEGR